MNPLAERITEEMVAQRLPVRPLDSHKGTFGRLLTVCGSYGMAGAALLCARGALRSGVGLVTAAVPESVYPLLAAAVPEAVTVALLKYSSHNNPPPLNYLKSKSAEPNLHSVVYASTV